MVFGLLYYSKDGSFTKNTPIYKLITEFLSITKSRLRKNW